MSDEPKRTAVKYPAWNWEGLSFSEKEKQWVKFYGYRFDESLDEPITTAAEALRVYSGMVLLKGEANYANKALARRAWLAAKKGGVCEMKKLKKLRPELGGQPDCNEQSIADYRFMRMWEFNHIVPRYIKEGQFVISGNDAARRAWHNVRNHALKDTVLLCRECHWTVTNYDKDSDIALHKKIHEVTQKHGQR